MPRSLKRYDKIHYFVGYRIFCPYSNSFRLLVHLWVVVLGEHMQQRRFSTLSVADHHDLTATALPLHHRHNHLHCPQSQRL